MIGAPVSPWISAATAPRRVNPSPTSTGVAPASQSTRATAAPSSVCACGTITIRPERSSTWRQLCDSTTTTKFAAGKFAVGEAPAGFGLAQYVDDLVADQFGTG